MENILTPHAGVLHKNIHATKHLSFNTLALTLSSSGSIVLVSTIAGYQTGSENTVSVHVYAHNITE